MVSTAVALTVFATGAARAQPGPASALYAFRPEADTYVSAARPEANFGRAPSLRADGAPRETTYLRFRLRKVKESITSVTLLLHARAGARRTFQVRRVSDNDWRERRLTFENAPRLSLRYASSKPVRRHVWNAVDVTSFVRGDSNRVSLAITTKGSRRIVFESRESSHGPRLVVRTDDKDGSEKPPLPF